MKSCEQFLFSFYFLLKVSYNNNYEIEASLNHNQIIEHTKNISSFHFIVEGSYLQMLVTMLYKPASNLIIQVLHFMVSSRGTM